MRSGRKRAGAGRALTAAVAACGLAGAGIAALRARAMCTGREREAECVRLRELARAAGLRIREHLQPADLIRAAQAVIETELGADAAHLHLLDEHGGFGLPAGHGQHRPLPGGFTQTMPPAAIEVMRECYRSRVSLVVQDAGGTASIQVPPEVAAWIGDAGIASHLLTPFGDGPDMLGVIAAPRLRPGRPWTAPEIEAVESIAADIGRGLHHARLYEAESRLVAELKTVDAMKTDFYTTVAHELRSPLTSIEGYVEMLSDPDAGTVADTQDQTLEKISRAAGRLRDLSEDLLTLAKVESPAIHPVRQAVNLADAIAAAIETVRPAATSGGLTLTSTCPPAGLTVEGDPSQLDRALVNLVSNAVKFTPSGGHVWVTGEAAGGCAAVTIRDTGIGIPEADRSHLFTRFFRASNATSRGIPGTGLGLAIIQAVITSHGGQISLHSREGQGTTATLQLPLKQPPQP